MRIGLFWLCRLCHQQVETPSSSLRHELLPVAGEFLQKLFGASLSSHISIQLFSKLSENGNIIWQKTYGGSDSDLFLSIRTQRIQTADYVLLAGASLSNNGDVSGNKGKSDGWLARLDAADGSVNWSKLYGGTADERLNDVIFDKDKTTILAVGYTESTDGDATGTFSTFGGGDAWLLRTKLDGNFEVGRRIGGTLKDVAFGVMQIKTKYDGYYVVGSTKSTDGYLNGIINRGGASDACLFRPVTISTTKEIASFSDLNIKLSPNPTSDNVWLDLKQTPSVPDLFSITNVFGQVVLTAKISDLNFLISTKHLSNGLYFLILQNEQGRAIKKFVKE